ncbi:telomerase reverse transcriptase-like [Oppia nitens]|uniref:telomerase reverse transcriptase-like n=1 Tax=Oppia nitens TaxID=1686743 RepID=UPI0023DB90A7|nr:telomerase reverse transcriptase-like [Oppia nitens]
MNSMENVLKIMYSSVIRLDNIAFDCIQSDGHLNEDLISFCQKTWIVSNESLNYRQLLSPKCQKSFETIADTTLNHYYNNYGPNQVIARSEAFNYLQQNANHLSQLYSILKETLFEYLLNKCLIFEDISDNCWQQVFGLSIVNKVWNHKNLIKCDFKTTVDKTEKLLNFNHKKSLKTMDKFFKSFAHKDREDSEEDSDCVIIDVINEVNINSQSTTSDKSATNSSKGKSILAKKCRIDRKLMLYSRQTSGQFVANFILSKPCLQSYQLFGHIFNSCQHFITTDAKRQLFSILNSIIVRHKKCRFDKLLDKYCPQDSYLIRNYGYELRYALDSYTTHKQIIQLIYSVLYYVIPIELFGNKNNFRIFYENCKLLVITGLNTMLFTSDFKRGIKLTDIKWFEELIDISNSNQIIDELIRWIIEYLITILRTKFYITETANYRTQLFFYRFDLWQKMKTKAIAELIKSGSFVQISDKQLTNFIPKDSSKVLILSSNRFVPKFSEFRQINRLKTSNTSDTKHLKSLLYLNLTVLKKLRLNQLKNYTINGQHYLQESIVKLKNMKNSGDFNKLYFIRADIKSCYPSISQNKMFDIIDKLFHTITVNNEIVVKEFDVIMRAKNKLFVKHIRYIESNDTKSLKQVAVDNNIKLKNCIIVGKSYVKSYKCNQLKDYLRTYIFKAIIKTNKKIFYHMKYGIRQGGMLSSELCSIYVESLVKHYFNDFGVHSSEIRLIQADDFLFITPFLMRAKAIVQIMLNGFNEYNLKVNLSKLKTNFHFDGHDISLSNELSFFGHIIDINTLCVSSDFSIYSEQNILNSFNCNPNSSLKSINSTLLRQLSMNLSISVLNSNVNDQRVVAKNIYERVLLQSIRLSAYIRVSPKWRSQQNMKVIIKFTQNISKRIYLLAKKWNDLKLIDFHMTYKEIELIATNAMISQWTFGKIAHRIQERNALKKFYTKIWIIKTI